MAAEKRETNDYEGGKYSIPEGGYHPSADMAYRWLQEFIVSHSLKYAEITEAIASCAISGNELANILCGTRKRLEEGLPVSDRYLLGYVWFIRALAEGDINNEDRTCATLKEEKRISQKVKENGNLSQRAAKTKKRKTGDKSRK